MSRYLLGYDLGSSSVKASLIEVESGKLAGSISAPQEEMEISSPRHGWAEQDPEAWWDNLVLATRQLLTKFQIDANAIQAVGISYQMHGLVLVDHNQRVLRPSIIWCDSRAVTIGENAYHQLGELYCMNRLLNSPGNFTASKLKWVFDNEPDIYKRTYKAMLPGDYIAMRLTGQISTTIPGLSEAVMWDYEKQTISERLFNFYKIDIGKTAAIVPTFGDQGRLTNEAAQALGLKAGTLLTYRAGDQPNNAFSLNALNPGEIATTAGTSGVIYGVTDKPITDTFSRVNTFVHVNHAHDSPRLGVMLCVNGTGIMNRWLQHHLSHNRNPLTYQEMNDLAAQAPIGSDNLVVMPFGNGAERVLQNRDIGASFHGLELNRHHAPHMCRAVQEGIVFALGYGFEVLNELGIKSSVIRAGHANMFLSEVFCEIFADITGTELQLFNTDGAQGAARAAGVGAGYYANVKEAFSNLNCIKRYEPNAETRAAYEKPFQRWKNILQNQLT